VELVIRGRRLNDADLTFIRSLIADPSSRCRSRIARRLCEAWAWTQPDGALKEAACRALLLQLELRGLILLPKRRGGALSQRRADRLRTQPLLPMDLGTAPLCAPPFHLNWRLAAGADALLYKDLLDARHYLGYRREVGHSLRYLACADNQPVAAVGWAAAAQKVAVRDRFIGWTPAQRLKNLHLVVNNTRFLVLNRVPHLASHLLAANTRRLAADWRARYGYAPVLLETFVDTTRFKGACYKAANWIFAGLTQGRGKYDRHTRRQETIKAVFLYPLNPGFRQILCHG
jgi:hypothetical protein